MLSRRLLRIKVIKEIFAQLMLPSPSPDTAAKNVEYSATKTYDLYHLMLLLAPELCKAALQQIEQRRSKHLPTAEDLNPNTRFADNSFAALILRNKPLADYCEKRCLSWTDHPEVARQLLSEIAKSKFFKDYMAAPTTSFDADKAVIVNIYSRSLEDFEPLSSTLEELSIFWADDLEFVLSQALKTFRTFTESQSNDTPLPPQYITANDAIFAKKLARRAVASSEEYRNIIEKTSYNWESERMAYMDMVLMITAIAELVEFEEIPVNVSLNEYIEIAKYYSTPNSSTFINGMLDKVAFDLKDSYLRCKRDQICKTKSF